MFPGRQMTPNRPFRIFQGFLASILALFVLSGCASLKPVEVKRDAGDLYKGALEAYYAGRLEESERTFKTLLEEHPMSQYSVDSQLMLGDVSYAMENFEDASAYYTSFISLHPSHPKAPYALFQKGMSHLKDVLTLDRDQTSTRKALFAFEDLVAAYPASTYAGKAGEFIMFLKNRLAEREFYIADFYYKKKNYKGALGRLRDLIKNYPDSGLTDKALYYIGESYMRLGERALAEEAFSALITNFPSSPFTRDARGRLKAG